MDLRRDDFNQSKNVCSSSGAWQEYTLLLKYLMYLRGLCERFLRTKGVWEHNNPCVLKQVVQSLVKTAGIYFMDM